MNKIYYLSTCSTCKKILKDTKADTVCEMQDLKKQHITPAELDVLAEKIGSYEMLFSRKSQKYKSLGLKDKQLSEQDYRAYILSDYTFLKRPIIIIGKKYLIGNDTRKVSELKNLILNGDW